MVETHRAAAAAGGDGPQALSPAELRARGERIESATRTEDKA